MTQEKPLCVMGFFGKFLIVHGPNTRQVNEWVYCGNSWLHLESTVPPWWSNTRFWRFCLSPESNQQMILVHLESKFEIGQKWLAAVWEDSRERIWLKRSSSIVCLSTTSRIRSNISVGEQCANSILSKRWHELCWLVRSPRLEIGFLKCYVHERHQ